MRLLTCLALAATFVLPIAADSQERAEGGGGAARGAAAELPLKPSRNVRFTTDEGTWMSLDVSPDGRTIVFDLVGDLYTLPIVGGKATRITDGMPFDAQPRWSPDGRQIVFVSDRDGSDDVWVVDANGRNARQITRTDRTQFLSPEWTPDGRYIVVSRNGALFSTLYALYLYHKDGGQGVRMVGAPPQQPPPPPPAQPTTTPPAKQ